MIPELFVIGIVVGLIYYEWVGFSPGGVIPPAYFALFIHQPDRLATTLVLSMIVCGVVVLLQRHTFLYGRRRLLAAVLLGFVFKWLAEQVLSPAVSLPIEVHAIGYVVPGLIANDMVRQRILPTALSLVIVSIVIALTAGLLGIGWSGS